MKKRMIRILCFTLVLVAVLLYTNKVFKIKNDDGIYSITKFYEQEKNTVDVLILGSSHAFVHFNTGQLWDEHGIASFILGGPGQPMWNSYYYLKEALKTQRPELIILEGCQTSMTENYSTENNVIIKNNYGMKWSRNKIESLLTSTPNESKTDILMEYAQYHNRYRELGAEDFLPDKGNPLYADWKGYVFENEMEALEADDYSLLTRCDELNEKVERYYRGILELAQENNIPIVVIVSPYPGIREFEQARYNMAENIASEYGVAFLNCNKKEIIDEIGIDFSVDSLDISHLNYLGSEKFTKYIGEWLTDKYDISDRRGNAEYDSWQRNADFTRHMIHNQELLLTSDVTKLVSLLASEKYLYFVSVDGNCTTADDGARTVLDFFGIPNDGSQGIWCIDCDGELNWYSGMDCAEQYIRIGRHDFKMSRQFVDDDYENVIFFDNIEQAKKTANGVNVVVYDKITESIADSIGFRKKDDFKLKR